MAKNKAEKAKKEVKNKRHFWKDFKAELKKVVWPTSKQLVNSTVAVITIVLVSALIVFLLDLGFEAIKTHGLDKLQTSLQSKYKPAEENTTSELTDDASSEETAESTENVEEPAAIEENNEDTTINFDDAENNQ